MRKTGQWEREIMAECQDGIKFVNGGGTGSFCKKPAFCREEGRCHFVTRAQLHEEIMQAKSDQQRRERIHWVDGFDEPDISDAPRIVAIPGINW